MPDGLTPGQAAFWAEFLASGTAPPGADQRFHSAFAIGEGSEVAAALVLSGRKTVTSSLPEEFLPGTEPVPGSLSILCGAAGRPCAVLETVSLRPISLDGMTPETIAAYAEWPDAASFRTAMLDWYRRVRPDFTVDTPLLVEVFRLVWVPQSGGRPS